MAGNKNSGRYKRGDKIKVINQKKNDLKIILNQKAPIQKDEQLKSEPAKIELVEETMDFESNAKRILAESEAAIAAEAPKKENIQNQNPEMVQKPKKEDWTPVAGMVMHVLGGLFQNATGVKELNYTEEEINECSPAISDLINLWFPDTQALTEDQKVILISASVIAKVHITKLKIYFDYKKEKAAGNANQTKTESAAA